MSFTKMTSIKGDVSQFRTGQGAKASRKLKDGRAVDASKALPYRTPRSERDTPRMKSRSA